MIFFGGLLAVLLVLLGADPAACVVASLTIIAWAASQLLPSPHRKGQP